MWFWLYQNKAEFIVLLAERNAMGYLRPLRDRYDQYAFTCDVMATWEYFAQENRCNRIVVVN